MYLEKKFDWSIMASTVFHQEEATSAFQSRKPPKLLVARECYRSSQLFWPFDTVKLAVTEDMHMSTSGVQDSWV